MNDHSELTATTLGVVYPFIMILGLYIIVNGHISPGGGFQGGAILAGVFTIQYLTTDTKNVSLDILNRVEKTIYLLLLLTGILIVFYMNQELTLIQKSYYLLLMNTLIGVKVSCGLTVIFYRFVLFESR